jgi:hypothetical protein
VRPQLDGADAEEDLGDGRARDLHRDDGARRSAPRCPAACTSESRARAEWGGPELRNVRCGSGRKDEKT